MENLTIEESARIVLQLAEQAKLTDEQVGNDPELKEEQERQEQAITNIEYNLPS